MNKIQRIELPEEFSFKDFEWFHEECSVALRKSRHVELKCDRVEFLDSAALGMIAMLHKKVQQANKAVRVSEPTAYCDDLFRLANMYDNYLVRSSADAEPS